MTEDEAKTKWVACGKRTGHSGGYIRVRCPEHPNTDASGYIYEHRFVMSNHLGRALRPGEYVHHIDENPANNDISNLALVTASEHALLHSDGLGANSNRPSCSECGAPIAYESRRRLCVDHYWQTVRQSQQACRVESCNERAGFRSGLCFDHVKHRTNKRRYSPGWEFPND